jgi:hypothetical protein
MREQFVYFARVVGTVGPIKIGCSCWPANRVRQLGIDTKTNCEVIAEIPGSFLLERNVHLKFAHLRCDGPSRADRDAPIAGATEWFQAAPDLLAFIEQAKKIGELPLTLEDCRERIFAARYMSGETLKQIGDDYGLTRERVRQVLASIGVKRRTLTEIAYVNSLKRRKRNEEWLASFGQRSAA